MSRQKKTYRYIEWLSAEEMHEASMSWISELNFTADEMRFLQDLVKTYTPQLTDSRIFNKSKEVVDKLLKKHKALETLMSKVRLHENQLDIMIDKVDQFKMEKAYIETHKDLDIAFNRFKTAYLGVKKDLFKLVSEILKREKQKRLLN